jgi:hypothetical protein
LFFTAYPNDSLLEYPKHLCWLDFPFSLRSIGGGNSNYFILQFKEGLTKFERAKILAAKIY